MLLDEIIVLIGEYGPFQRRISMLYCLSVVGVAVHILAPVFLSAETDHWCATDLDIKCNDTGLDGKQCVEFIKNLTIPFSVKDGNVYEQCVQYSLTGLDANDFDVEVGDVGFNLTEETQSCETGFEYDRSQYKSTTVQDVSCFLITLKTE